MANTTARVAPAPPSDFRLEHQGTIAVLFPLSSDAADWCWNHLPADAQRWCGGVVIEHRYVEDILFGIHNDGLVVR